LQENTGKQAFLNVDVAISNLECVTMRLPRSFIPSMPERAEHVKVILTKREAVH